MLVLPSKLLDEERRVLEKIEIMYFIHAFLYLRFTASGCDGDAQILDHGGRFCPNHLVSERLGVTLQTGFANIQLTEVIGRHP